MPLAPPRPKPRGGGTLKGREAEIDRSSYNAKYVFLCPKLFSSPITNRSGHPGTVSINKRNPRASFGTLNSNCVVYDAAGVNGVINEVPALETTS
jgi:hypothetical protein